VEGGRAGERARGELKVCLASSPLFLFSSFVFFCFLGHIGWLAKKPAQDITRTPDARGCITNRSQARCYR